MRLRTLGDLTLEGSAFGRPKPLLLLAYLALEGPKDRRHLSELFWPAAAHPMTSLRVALSQLRRGAPGAMAVAGSRLIAAVESDAGMLLLSSEQGACTDVARCYERPFLDGFYLADCGAELEEWIYGTREFLAEKVRAAHLWLAEGEAAGGSLVSAAARAEVAYRLPGAPDPEPKALERLYALLVAGGSLRAEECERDAAGYGIRLRLTAEEASARLLRPGVAGQARGPAVVPHHLPAPSTSFVGRDPELIELARLLAEPATRLITITGAGGMGKSRLAIQAAHGELRGEHFADGIYFVSLEALVDPGLVTATIASALNVPLSETEAPLAQLVRALGSNRLLLVLDNFEQLMAGAVVLSELLEGCPNLKLLVTSRERLNLADEQRFPLEGLPLPEDVLGLEDAKYRDAVRIFLQRARRAQPDFALSTENIQDVVAICRSVGGLPLGIELAAAWVRVMPVTEIAGEITRSLDLLADGARDLHERQQSVRATFEHSWKLLSAKEQQVMTRLAVFVGGFTREAASAVAGATIPILVSLVDKSLLRVLGGGRYDRHPLLYRYTQEKLAERPEEAIAQHAAHARYFVRLAEESEARHQGAEQVAWLDRLDREQSNLRAALAWALAGGAHESGLRLAAALYHFWYYRSYLLEGAEWLERALTIAATNAAWDALRSRLLSAAGALANERGDDDRAVLLFEERLALARAQGDRIGQAAALNSLGIVAWGRHDHALAQSLMEAGLQLRRELGQAQRVSVSLNNLGLVALVRGELDEARGYLEESLAMSRTLGDEMGVAMALANLGAVALEAGDSGRAERLLRQALPRYRALGDQTALAQCLENFAAIAVRQERSATAARLAGAAEALRGILGAVPRAEERVRHDRDLAPARAALGEAAFSAAWQRGRAMSAEEAVAYALAGREGAREERH